MPSGKTPEPAPETRTSTLVWGLPLALLVMSIVAVPVMIVEPQGLPRYRQLRAELARLRQETDALAIETSRLTEEVRSLRSDPQALGQVARDELGFIEEGEVVLLFPERP